jgi:DNA-binding LacI/PurR family transcriptional regulator
MFKNITMKEIAALAGISKATVSRAIHSPHLVHPDTRKQVLQIMSEHNYIYNAHAADFSRRKTTIIGLIIPTMSSSIHAESVHGIQQKIQETKFSLIIGNTNYNLQMELNLLSLFEERRLAGVILTGIKPQTEEFVKSSENRGMPCVITWETVDDKDINYVGFDNFKAAYTVTKYLTSLGHRRIGMIMGPYNKALRVRQRQAGYRAALEENGIDFDPTLTIAKEPTLLDGKESMKQLLSLPERPTALFAASDVLAVGAIHAIKSAGLRIPQDISVAGFDDIDMAAYCDPPLTTIRVPAFQMGQLAVRVILAMIESKTHHSFQYCLDTDLIIRDSCSPPARA